MRPPSSVLEMTRPPCSGCLKSPPTATPCRESRKATEKIPEDEEPAMMGVAETLQFWPRSEDRNTRAVFAPPVQNQALRSS